MHYYKRKGKECAEVTWVTSIYYWIYIYISTTLFLRAKLSNKSCIHFNNILHLNMHFFYVSTLVSDPLAVATLANETPFLSFLTFCSGGKNQGFDI